MERPKQRELVVRLDQSSPWEGRLFRVGALCLLGGLLLAPGNSASYGAWGPPLILGIYLLATGLSMRMLSSSQARIEPTQIHIFSTAADDPVVANRVIEKSEISAIEVMRVRKNGWFGSTTTWEVTALLGNNRRQPLVSWTNPEQALQAARSSARVLDVPFRDADIEQAPAVEFPAAAAPMGSFGEFARTVRESLVDPRSPLYGIGFDASEDAVKLYLWKQELRGFIGLAGAVLFGLMGVIVSISAIVLAHMEWRPAFRPVSGTIYLLGLTLAIMTFRHLVHLGQRNVLILRPADVAVQSFSSKGDPVVRVIPIANVEYMLVPRSPSILVVGADREIVARGGVSRSAYLRIAELLRQAPGWPKRAEVKM